LAVTNLRFDLADNQDRTLRCQGEQHQGGLAQRVRAKRGPMTGSGVIRPVFTLRAQSDLLNRIKLMLAVQSPSQKYLRFLLTQITSMSFASRPKHKGRFAIVTNVGQGMRWTQAALLTRALICGRRSRVVLTPRRWRQVGGRHFR
jgi:hypothetical protein